MPSSTSSSSERPVEGPWGWTWALTFVLLVGVFGAVEMRLRERGYSPSTNMDNELWSTQRQKLYWPDKTPIALIGASRISAGFRPQVFNSEYSDYRAVMLARAGKAPFATLEHLANDESFDEGIVVVSMLPDHMTKRRRGDQKGIIKAYERLTENYGFINKFANRQIQAHFDDALAFRSPSVDLKEWFDAELGDQQFPGPNYVRVHPDSSRSLDFSKKGIKRHRAERVRKRKRKLKKQPPPKPKRWLKGTRKINDAIDRLLDRGVEVVVVRYPTCGKFYELDKKHYPRKKYWDAFAKQTRAKTIHFEDYESLTGYECPDYSHINARDVPKFTRALGGVLEELGVIER